MVSPGVRLGVVQRRAMLVLILALVAGACTGDDDAADEPGPTTIPPARTVLRVGAEDWPDCLNPLTCDSPALREQVLQHVLPVALEVDAAGEYRPSPLLAAEPGVRVGPDGMTITYRLDPDARWEDGRPITSSDLRATWRAVMTTPGADQRGYDLITDVDDEDPSVAVVRLSAPYGEWQQLFGGGRGWVLQADAFGPSTDLTGMFQDELPFSAAPYQLAAWDEDAAVLARSEAYWDESRRPGIDQVRLTNVTVSDLRDPAAFHVLVPAGPDSGPTPDGFAARSLPTAGVVGVWFDRRTPLLDVLPHRQALAMLVDREAIVDGLASRVAWRGPEGELPSIDCLGWLPEVGPWCDAASAELPEPDRDLGTLVLALEGWLANESGDVVRDGVPFALPISHDPGVPGAAAVASEVTEAFESIGITTVGHEVSTATWLSERVADPQTGVGVFAFDLGLSPQVSDLYGCPNGPPSSVLAWCPDEVVTAARDLDAAVDRRTQLELVPRIGTAAADDVAWIPIFRQAMTSFFDPDVVRFPDAVPAVGGPLAALHGFTVEE